MTTEHQQAEREAAGKITRYDRDEGGMFPSGSGDWVRYEHYLEQMNASMKVPPGMALVPIEPTPEMIEAVAKQLAICMDYSWEYMPSEGKHRMRINAHKVLAASQDSAKETK